MIVAFEEIINKLGGIPRYTYKILSDFKYSSNVKSDQGNIENAKISGFIVATKLNVNGIKLRIEKLIRISSFLR